MDQRPGGNQEIGALGDDQLADEDHPRARGGRELAQRPHRRAAVPSQSLFLPATAADPGRERLNGRQRIGGLAGPECRGVDAGGPEPRLGLQIETRQRPPEALGGVARANQHRRGTGGSLLGVRQEARVGLHRVLERRAVDLGGEAQARSSEDQRPHHEMVGERRVGIAGVAGNVLDRVDVGRDVAIELGVAELGECLHLEARVVVVDIDRKQTADVGPDRRSGCPPPPGRGAA